MPPVPPLYVDFDDVLCETARGIAGLLEREFGKTVRFEDIATFDLAVAFGLNVAEIDHLMRLTHLPANLAAMAPVDGAVPALRRWAARGGQVAVVTGRPASCFEASRDWLQRHGVPHDALIFVDKYGRPDPHPAAVGARTLDQLRCMEFALAVEDSPQMVTFLCEHMRMPVVVLDRPWNARLAAPAGAGRAPHRCRSWSEVERLLPGLGGGVSHF